MAHILFQVAPVRSHLNSSFALANKLRELGHTITYTGYINFSSEYEEFVRSKGYNFYKLDKVPSDFVVPTFNFFQKMLLSIMKEKKRGTYQVIKRIKDFVVDPSWFKQLFNDLNPDIYIFDVFEVNYALSLLLEEAACKIFIFQDKFVTNRDPAVPPLNSSYVPKGPFDKWVIPLLWNLSYLKQKLSINYLLGLDNLQVAKKIGNSHGKRIDTRINNHRSFQFELKGVSELILSPIELDFPRKTSYSNKYYLGASTNLKRKDLFYDWKYKEDREQIFDLKEKENRKIIYCSLGSVSTTLSTPQKCIDFYQRVIKACANNKKYVIILSIGDSIDFRYFNDLPNNAFVYQVVPQTEILSYSDLMISHGGTKSIIECVLSEVPILAFPTNKKWDQAGNTARIVYHRLGLSGSFMHVSPSKIESKIKQILSSSIYTENIREMHKMISSNPQYLSQLEGISYLKSIIKCIRPGKHIC